MSVREPILKPVAIADPELSRNRLHELLGVCQAHSWVQFSQWVQHGCSAVPAAAVRAQVRHREAFSPKSSTRRRGEAQAQS